jgi:hypothetical protein
MEVIGRYEKRGGMNKAAIITLPNVVGGQTASAFIQESRGDDAASVDGAEWRPIKRQMRGNHKSRK